MSSSYDDTGCFFGFMGIKFPIISAGLLVSKSASFYSILPALPICPLIPSTSGITRLGYRLHRLPACGAHGVHGACWIGEDLHVITIPPNSKRKAAMNKLFGSIRVRVFEMATGEHSFLAGVEGYGSEFLPVAYGGVFDYEFVDGEFTLVVCQLAQQNFGQGS